MRSAGGSGEWLGSLRACEVGVVTRRGVGRDAGAAGGGPSVSRITRQPAFSAPSMRWFAPETYSDSSDSSHMTRLATSAAVP